MSIATEISRLQTAKSDLKTAIESKGVAVSSSATLDDYPALVSSIITSGTATLITKTITANGTYNASSDSADGYSSVTVNIPVVTGTFTGTTAGEVLDITLDYTGSGYPIMLSIFPAEGSYNSDGTYYSLIQNKAKNTMQICKAVIGEAPDYTDSSSDANWGYVMSSYKNSTSSSTSYSRGGGNNFMSYDSAGAVASSANASAIFKSNTVLSVQIASTNHGFAAGIPYLYQVLYSS